ncbi:MAG: FAD-dependent oxidoreductase [Gammaproteobacteria bacterium]|nr:FAD-dependent oxidoreductase [Gammaproteobacteria bacterium]
MTRQIETDISIIGGGIAGLWLLNSLRDEGFNAILLERDQLGSDQTIASQGMIHGGIKYTLSGSLTGSSDAIADMPGLWRACIAGEHRMDLRAVKVLSDHYYMWSDDRLTSKLTAFFGSKALRGRVIKLSRQAYPPAFDSDRFNGSLYQLGDLVLDIPSLLDCLSQRYSDWIFKLDTNNPGSLVMESDSRIKHIIGSSDLTIRSSRYIFSAGAGNGELLRQAGLSSPAMQLRPLHQVLVKHRFPHPVYAHCVNMKSGAKPRLTITTHPTTGGYQIWNLGGDLAETGVFRNRDEQINFARSELNATLPWIDLDQAEWQSFRIDRAEPEQPGQLRPENSFAESVGNIIVTWPIKLSLTPSLADSVSRLLSSQGVMPEYCAEPLLARQQLTTPEVAIPLWQDLFPPTSGDL